MKVHEIIEAGGRGEFDSAKAKSAANSMMQLSKEMAAASEDEGDFMAKLFALLSEAEDILFDSGVKFMKASNGIVQSRRSLERIPTVEIGLKKMGW
jgi:hypothetical protein